MWRLCLDAAVRRSMMAQIAVGLASFLTPFIYGALSVAMPTMGRDFDFSPHSMAMVLMVHLLVSTSCNVPFARFSDRVGRKNVFMAGSLLFAISSLMAGLAHAPWFLIAARALQGLGDAMTFGVSAAILVSMVPPERAGRALGVNIMFVYAGLALGPLVGGALTSYTSWRMIFFFSAVCGVGALLLIRKNFVEVPSPSSGPLDARGAALYLPGLLALILGISQMPSLFGAGLTILSLMILAAFYRAENRHSHPLVDFEYLRGNRPFTLANLTSTLGYAAAFSTSFLASLLLQNVMGLPAQDAGYLLLVQPVVLTLVSPLAGIASDRFHPAKVSAAGLVILGMGLFGLSGHGPQAFLVGVALWLAVAGVGFALFVSPNIHAIMQSADAPRMGMASGLLATMRGLGMCLSLSVTGIVLTLFVEGQEAAQAGPEILPALKICFVLSGLTALIAAWVSWQAKGNERG